MVTPIYFPEVDKVEDYLEDFPSRPLPVKSFPTHTVSCWQFDANERAEIAKKGSLG